MWTCDGVIDGGAGGRKFRQRIVTTVLTRSLVITLITHVTVRYSRPDSRYRYYNRNHRTSRAWFACERRLPFPPPHLLQMSQPAAAPPVDPVGNIGDGPFRTAILTVRWQNDGSTCTAQQIGMLVTAGFTLRSCVYIPAGPACSSELLQYTFTSLSSIPKGTKFRSAFTGPQLNALV